MLTKAQTDVIGDAIALLDRLTPIFKYISELPSEEVIATKLERLVENDLTVAQVGDFIDQADDQTLQNLEALIKSELRRRWA